jgi:hypothetical protein
MKKHVYWGSDGRSERWEKETQTYTEWDEENTRRQEQMMRNLRLARVDETDDGRYLMRPERERWSGYSWIEVVTVANGILVHGDCDTVLFRGCSGPPRGKISWQARYNPDYGAEKATLADLEGRTWERRVAANFILEMRLEARARPDEPFDKRPETISKENARTLYDALLSNECSQSEFIEACSDVGLDDMYSIGMVPAQRIYAAQAALRHLQNLLGARDMRAQARAWYSAQLVLRAEDGVPW